MMLIVLRLMLFFVVFTMTTVRAMAGSGAYRLEVPDAGSAGKGSAFVGEANTPAAVYWNPAGMTQIVGQAVSTGACLVQPRASFESASGDQSQMKPGNFGIPHMYYVYGAQSFALGVGMMSNWGLTTEWLPNGFARYYSTKTVMQNKDYLLAGALKVNDQLSLALGLDIDDSSLDQQKKFDQSGVGGTDGNVRLKGTDTAYGFRVAGMFRLNEQNQFGLMYRSQIRHKYEGKVHIDGMHPIVRGAYDFDPTTGSYETPITYKSTLPDSIVFGYSFKPDDKWTFNADLEWMNWSVVEHQYVDYSSESNAQRRAFLEQGNSASSKDWKSVFSFSLGTEYKMADNFRLRGGYYHHESPIPSVTWGPVLPDADSNGFATGFGYDITKNLTFDFAWSALLYDDRKIDNSYAPAGTYKQWISMTYATTTYKF
ncbi:MAG: outer membrane protein transport protein [Candidatus Omnitrophica bacterium]|nr:outer membrane protein transport protein [Candidatus Omnitrophota bacterium]